MAPDLGTNEQTMAWFMDTFSMHQGHAVSEIVTGKPVAVGGTLRRSEATGRGVAHLVGEVMRRCNLTATHCTAIVQGFGNVGQSSARILPNEMGVKVIGVSDHPAAARASGHRYAISSLPSLLHSSPSSRTAISAKTPKHETP